MTERTKGHAFISYVREDAACVDRLQRALEAAGIRVWRDTEDLWPGQDWKLEIKRAINEGSLAFIACFSDNSAARATSYQNEELVLAVEQMRLRPPGKVWLFPIRFSDCDVPEYDLGAGRSLGSLQRVDLYEERWDGGIARLVASVVKLLAGTAGDQAPQPTPPPASASAGEKLKVVLLDPNRQIEVEDIVTAALTTARERLLDDQEFPTEGLSLKVDVEGVRYFVGRAHAYEDVMQPLMTVLALGCTWGRSEHDSIWARTVQLIAKTVRIRSGVTSLVDMQRYPLNLAMYAASLAAVHRRNFGALKAVTVDAKVRREYEGAAPAVSVAHPWLAFENNEITARALAHEGSAEGLTDEAVEALVAGRGLRYHTPLSNHLNRILRPIFADLIIDDEEFLETFDETEVYLGLIATDARIQAHAKNQYLHPGYVGAFSYRHRYMGNDAPEKLLAEDQAERGDQWPPIQAGLFGGSSERAKAAFESYKPEVDRARQNRF